MLLKISSRLSTDRERGIGLAETVIAVLIMVLVLTSTAYALAAAFNGSGSSQNFNKAYQLITKQFAVARQVSYDKLGLVPSEAQTEQQLVAGLHARAGSSDPTQCLNSSDSIYNRTIDIPSSNAVRDSVTKACPEITGDNSIVCPTYTAGSTYNGEARVEIPYSNSGVSGVFANNSDPGTSQNVNYPIYCGWYQFAQGNGDVLYKDDVSICASSNTSSAPHKCQAGGVGTIFTVETDVTWVNASNFDTTNGSAARDDSGQFTDCNSVANSGNCFQAKRVTVTVRWTEATQQGAIKRGVSSSFIRSPSISECIPVGGNGFVANATPVATPQPTSNAAISGVSCGQQ